MGTDRGNFFKVFILLFILAVFFIFLSQRQLLKPISNFFQRTFFSTLNIFPHKQSTNSEIDSLKLQNAKLETEVNDYQNLKNENQALRDQFKTSYPESENLIPAKIIGFPDNFENENISYLIIDQGSKSGVNKNSVVVFQNNFIGLTENVSNNFSKVFTLFSGNFSLAAQDENTSAFGIVKNESGEIILDNVLTSDHLKVGDLVETAPSENENSNILPNLVIGKILSVQKDPSSLFQKAVIVPLYNYKNLSVVFIE